MSRSQEVAMDLVKQPHDSKLKSLELINLPDIVLELILSKLTYDEISKTRVVCKLFDRICKKLLNRGFILMEKYHKQCVRTVKSKLPRRESERRSHPLAYDCEILSSIETRISMLTMTFTKYVDLNLCCFIPGKVLDEIFRILRLIQASQTPPKSPEILQELRDISSMAIEHFDEKILPDLRHSICSHASNSAQSYDLPTYMPTRSITIAQSPSGKSSVFAQSYTPDSLSQTFKKIYSRTRRNKISVISVKGQISKMKLRLKRQSFLMRLQSLKLQEHAKKLYDQDMQMAEMRKHLEEWEQKLGDVSAELSRAREDVIQKPVPIDSNKRRMDAATTASILKDVQVKKRKLIVERKSSTDAQDVKFRKFLSELLSESSMDDGPSTSH